MTTRIPSATYRLQLHRGFNFHDALELADYLNDLGVSDCYLSPITRARPGSIHGYDVIDHRTINPELGSEDDFRAFATALKEKGMGIVADIVPNHMCIADRGNTWWQDVLENGPSSPYADFFDIDWNPPKADLANKVLLPVLGDQYGRVLENQEISIVYRDGSFLACYYEQCFPIAPRSLTWILEPAVRRMVQGLGESHPEVLELESILTAVQHLPERTETEQARIRERRREVQVIKRRIATLYQESRAFRSALDHSLDDLNGVKGDPSSFDQLERLLADQAYRLSFWKVASDEINYRRFFDINELAAIRMEDRAVFAATHELIFRLVGEGLVAGLRVDHVDGLLDPLQYLRRLQRAAASAISGAEHRHLNGSSERPLYVVTEKILGAREHLSRSWPVHGTTGYDLMNVLGGLFVRGENQRRIHDTHARFTGMSEKFEDVAYESKRLILKTAMAGEIAVLSRRLDRISEQHRWSRDFTLNSLTAALEEVIACFPVYRSYIRRDEREVSAEDRRYIEIAIARAKRRNPAMSESIFDFLASVLLLRHPDGLTEAHRAERREFVMRFQQITAPVMAKGFEDTALYRYYPLASLNEVGGDPGRFGIELDAFHEWSGRRAAEWPDTMSATSSHDTKRGEDTRARISVLSEIPGEWEQAIYRWYEMNSSARKEIEEGRQVPDPNEEYLLYQTLVGVWPNAAMDAAEREEFTRRIQAYVEKAVKEAKINTSWMNVNEEHDRALREFVAQVLSREEFLRDFSAFQERIARAGMLNSLSQTVLKIAMPGMPDFYQGTELWAFNLVDPDNRRPVDYQLRRAMLAKIRESVHLCRRESVRQMLRDMNSGAIKMYVTSCALEFRRRNPGLFAQGSYVPLAIAGERSACAVAFARRFEAKTAIAVCGRFFMSIPEAPPLPADPEAWRDTYLLLEQGSAAASAFTDLFTGHSVTPRQTAHGPALPLREVFSVMPAALLIGNG